MSEVRIVSIFSSQSGIPVVLLADCDAAETIEFVRGAAGFGMGLGFCICAAAGVAEALPPASLAFGAGPEGVPELAHHPTAKPIPTTTMTPPIIEIILPDLDIFLSVQ